MSSTPVPERSPGGPDRRGEATRVLAGVTSARAVREQAERDQLSRVLDWAVVHQIPVGRPETSSVFEEPCLAVAGPGAPRVPEYAALELAAALGLSTEAGLDYLGNAIEVRYRLPKTWARLAAGKAGGLTVWRAFRIAARTRALCAAGAAEVDARLSGFAHQVGAAQIDRTVSAAMAAHDPDTAARLAAEAHDARHFDIHLGGATPADRQGLRATAGVVEVTGLLDMRDALDLEAAVADGAARLAGLTPPVADTENTDDDAGPASGLSLAVRRSIAVGDLARRQLTLDLAASGDGDGDGGEGDRRPDAAGGRVVVYAHLHPDSPTVELDTPGVAGVRTWVGVLRDWCQTAGTQVTIKPVIDLASNPVSTGYQPSTAVTEVVELRDRRCRFPWCTRPARGSDKDHRTDFDDGGPTSAHNMAPLCRRHHRAKTHSDWTYRPTSGAPPGHFTWTSPSGLRITVGPHGTHTLDPPD